MTRAHSATEICFLPATELAARIRRRDLSPVEVVDAYLARIGERNPVINAYTLVLADKARAAAKAAENAVMAGGSLGPLHGVPVAIKDMDDVAGVPTSMGSLAIKNYVPKTSTILVQRWLAAGAIILGKTNTPEFGHKGITDNPRFGPTSTPYAIGRNAGGSSGGSAAAIADGLAALAQGTDGGGSVRIPASFSGCVGFKPSFGRIPSVTRPDGHLWSRPLVHLGPLARTVGDAALATQVAAGPHGRDPLSLPDQGINFRAATGQAASRLRIAYSPRLGSFPVDPAVAAVVRDAVNALAASGFTVEEHEPRIGPHHSELAALWIRTVAVHYAAIADYLKCNGIDLLGEQNAVLTEDFRALLDMGRGIGAVDHMKEDVLRTQVLDALEDVFETFDVIVSPTMAVPPVINGTDGLTRGPQTINGETVDPLIGFCMTYPINYTGHPAISVPAGLTPDGLPIGLQVIGRRHDDMTVLAMAAAVERLRPWFDTYPGLRAG